jgi:hypothetical protein
MKRGRSTNMMYLFYLVLFSGIGCGFLFPQLGAYRYAVPYFIGFTLFLNFLEITVRWDKFLRVQLCVTFLLSTFIMPFLYYKVLSTGIDEGYRIGVLLTAVAPGSVIMLILSRFVPYKDYNLILSNFFFTTFGSILYIPVVVKWFVGATVEVDITQLFFRTAALILIPYSMSVVMKKTMSPEVTLRVRAFSKGFILLPIFIVVTLSMSGAAQQMVWDRTLLTLAPLIFSIFLVQGGLAFLVGRLFWDKNIRNSLALMASARNVQLMLGIAIINFPPLAAVPIVLGIIVQNINHVLWLWLLRK